MNKIKHSIFFITILQVLLPAIVFAHFTTKGPYGGSVKCMLTNDTLIYVGTYDGGVYRSINTAASSWKYANYTGLTNGSINALAAIGNVVLAGTAGGGVFVTTDIGNSWTSPNTGLTNKNILALIAAGDHIVAGTQGGGVFLSHDSGTTWEASNVGLTSTEVTSLTFDGVFIYAGTNAGVFISIDEGDSWQAINTGLIDINITSITSAGNYLYAATPTGVFVSSNSTINWVLSNTGLIDPAVNSFAAFGNTLYAATNNGVYTSTDNGATWSNANAGYTDTVMAIAAYNNKLYAGTLHDGIYRSNSTTTISWTEFNTGFNNLKTFAIYNSNLLVIAATNKGLFVSRDLAANYIASNAGLTDSLHITSLTFAGTKLYVATQNAGIFVSADTGTTWMSANTGLSNLNTKQIIATNTHLLVACANGEVYSTPINTINWVVNTGLPANIIPTAFATDGSSHAFLGTQGNGVFMSMDFNTWTASNTGLTNMDVTALAISGATLFAGTNGGGVFQSGFMNSSWAAINTGLPTANILSLCASGVWVAAGYKGGVHVTYNGGNSWVAPNVMQYIPAYANVNAISFTPASTRIFVATPNNSLYSNGVAELPTGINEIATTIGQISISPNPNNGNMNIDVQNVKAEIKDIAIFDIMGRLMQTVTKPEGEEVINLSAPYPAGIYFMSIRTNKGILSNKIIIQ